MDARLAAYLELAAVPDEELVDRLYRLVLRRDAEPEVRRATLARLQAGTLSRASLLHDLVESAEFERVRTLDDAVALAAEFRLRGERLRGIPGPPQDERVIEIPWCLARYLGEQRVLDVGYAFAEPVYLAALTGLGIRDLVGVDLAQAEVPGMRTVVADLRKLPFASRSFELAYCISTIEHVGLDNTLYGIGAQDDPRGMRRALKELRRVLVPKGRLVVSVPCGEEERHDWFVQHTPDAWLELFQAAGFLLVEHEVYELGADSWLSAPEFSPAGVRYGQRGRAASAVLCVELERRTLEEVVRRRIHRLRNG